MEAASTPPRQTNARQRPASPCASHRERIHAEYAPAITAADPTACTCEVCSSRLHDATSPHRHVTPRGISPAASREASANSVGPTTPANARAENASAVEVSAAAFFSAPASRAERNAASSGTERAATRTACAYAMALAANTSCANRHAWSRREPRARSVAAATNANPKAGKNSTTGPGPGPGASGLARAVESRALGDHDHAECAAPWSSSEAATRKSSPPRMTCTRTAASATCAPSTLGTSTSRRRRRSMNAPHASSSRALGCAFGPAPPECIRCRSSPVSRMHRAKAPRAAVAPRRRVSATPSARMVDASRRIPCIFCLHVGWAREIRSARTRARGGGVDRGAGAGTHAWLAARQG